MKQLFTILCIISLIGKINAQNLIYANGAMPIDEAHKQGKLALSLRGSYNPNRLQSELLSSHYGKCIDIKMKNNSDSVLNVVVQCGTMLMSQDSSAQNMLITKTLYFSLSPKEQKIDRLYAMCGQLHKNAPDILISYKVGKIAPQKLLRLANVIEATSAQNKAGQYAVWALTDNATRFELGDNLEVLKKSQDLLNKANIPINLIKNWDSAEEQKIDSQLVELWDLPHSPTDSDIDTISVQGQAVAFQESRPIFLTRQTAKLTDDNTTEVVVGVGATLLLASALFFWYKKTA